MDMRPYVSFQEVKQRVPISEALAELGLGERLTRNGDVLTGVCPLPSHQHGPQPNAEQFKIDKKGETWLWHCFGDCNRGDPPRLHDSRRRFQLTQKCSTSVETNQDPDTGWRAIARRLLKRGTPVIYVLRSLSSIGNVVGAATRSNRILALCNKQNVAKIILTRSE